MDYFCDRRLEIYHVACLVTPSMAVEWSLVAS